MLLPQAVSNPVLHGMRCVPPSECARAVGAVERYGVWLTTGLPSCCATGVGPCAQKPHFKKESDTLLVGTEESQCAAGMCPAMCHNKGDKFEVKNGRAEWTAGNSPFHPPCFHGKLIAYVYPPNKGGGPSCDEMQR